MLCSALRHVCLRLLYVTSIRDFFCSWNNRARLCQAAVASQPRVFARLLVGNKLCIRFTFTYVHLIYTLDTPHIHLYTPYIHLYIPSIHVLFNYVKPMYNLNTPYLHLQTPQIHIYIYIHLIYNPYTPCMLFISFSIHLIYNYIHIVYTYIYLLNAMYPFLTPKYTSYSPIYTLYTTYIYTFIHLIYTFMYNFFLHLSTSMHLISNFIKN